MLLLRFMSHFPSLPHFPPSFPPSLPPSLPPCSMDRPWSFIQILFYFKGTVIENIWPQVRPSLPPSLPPSLAHYLPRPFSSCPPRQARHSDTHTSLLPPKYFFRFLTHPPTPPSLRPSLPPFV